MSEIKGRRRGGRGRSSTAKQSSDESKEARTKADKSGRQRRPKKPKSDAESNTTIEIPQPISTSSRREGRRDKKVTRKQKEEVPNKVPIPIVIPTEAQRKSRPTRIHRMGLPMDSLDDGGATHLLTVRNLPPGTTEADVDGMLQKDPTVRDQMAAGGVRIHYVSRCLHHSQPRLSHVDVLLRSSFASIVGGGLFDANATEPLLAHFSAYMGGENGPTLGTCHAVVLVADPAHIPLVASLFEGRATVEHSACQPLLTTVDSVPQGSIYGDGDFVHFATNAARQHKAVEAHINVLDAQLCSASGGDAQVSVRSSLPNPVTHEGIEDAIEIPTTGRMDGVGFDASEEEVTALEHCPAGGGEERTDTDDAVRMRLQAWSISSQIAASRESEIRRPIGSDPDAPTDGQSKMMTELMRDWVGSGGNSSRHRATKSSSGEEAVLQQLRDARKGEKERAEAERIQKIIEARRTEKKERDAEARRKEQAAVDAARQLGVLTENTNVIAEPIKLAKKPSPPLPASSNSFTVTSSRQAPGSPITGIKKR